MKQKNFRNIRISDIKTHQGLTGSKTALPTRASCHSPDVTLLTGRPDPHDLPGRSLRCRRGQDSEAASLDTGDPDARPNSLGTSLRSAGKLAMGEARREPPPRESCPRQLPGRVTFTGSGPGCTKAPGAWGTHPPNASRGSCERHPHLQQAPQEEVRRGHMLGPSSGKARSLFQPVHILVT